VEARLHAPGAVDPRAGVDQYHLGACRLEQRARRKADVLGAQVTGRMVCDGAERTAEIAIESLRLAEVEQELHQVLGRVGDALRLGRVEQLRVLGLEQQRARRARHHHLGAVVDRADQVGDVALGIGAQRSEIARVRVRHAAAALVADVDANITALEHLDRRAAGQRVVVVHAAGREQHGAPVAALGARAPLAEPTVDRLEVVRRLHPVAVDADRLLHCDPRKAVAVGEVHQRRRGAADLAEQVGLGGQLARERRAVAPGAHELLASHQQREVDVPVVRRGVRTVVVTELAVEAELVDLVEAPHRDSGDLVGRRVDQLEQLRERGAERQTAAALVADVADAAQLSLEGIGIPESGIIVGPLGGWRFRSFDFHRRCCSQQGRRP
jgi:hypothetical protein